MVPLLRLPGVDPQPEPPAWSWAAAPATSIVQGLVKSLQDAMQLHKARVDLGGGVDLGEMVVGAEIQGGMEVLEMLQAGVDAAKGRDEFLHHASVEAVVFGLRSGVSVSDLLAGIDVAYPEKEHRNG